jgi:hypothetical protein
MRNVQLEKTTAAYFQENSVEKTTEEKRLIKLMRNYYFDPVAKYIIKRSGTDFSFVSDNRRLREKPVDNDRRMSREPVDVHPKLISQGLYWDAEGKKVYKKVRGKFILYSKDRRQPEPV